MGLRVERGAHVYASTQPGVLTLGQRDALDSDDCLAQMIFHELCHSLIEGEQAFDRPDWGLDNTSDVDTQNEHACLRLQAFLADRLGLRDVLAPTTEYRPYYDALPIDPLSPRSDPSVVRAILGAQRSEKPPWSPHLGQALRATAAIVHTTKAVIADRSSLFYVAQPIRGIHASGFATHVDPSKRCLDCAWLTDAGQCRHAPNIRLNPLLPACERYETALDCRACGACCRAAYHSVEVAVDDPIVKRHPELVVLRETYLELERRGDRCAALSGELETGFHCNVYADRPATCREFEREGENCLTARRRVGLSL
jgi:hypothetical protein